MIRPGPFGCFDVHLYDDERVAKLSGNAQSLFVAMTLYACAELTDGRVPSVIVPRLMLASKSKRRHLAELLETGLVEQLPITDGYYLPGYLKWNPAREEVERKRQLNRDRQAAQRERNTLTRTLRSVS